MNGMKKTNGTCKLFKNPVLCIQSQSGLAIPDLNICSNCLLSVSPTEDAILINMEDAKSKQDVIIELCRYFSEKYQFKTIYDNLYIYQDGIYGNSAIQKIKKLSEDIIPNKLTAPMVEEIYQHLLRKNYPSDGKEEEINPKDFLPLTNGLLNLERMEIEPFNQDKIFLFRLPVNYDHNAKCPKFQKVLSEIFADNPRKILLLQEIFGYCLCPAMPAQKSFWFYGTGANGKSTIANILIELLGKNNVSSIDLFDIEYGRFALDTLNGKLANILGEPTPRELEKSTNFKKLTGGDLISADRKNRERIEFVNTAKMIIYANQYPAISDTTEAFWRRIIVLGFVQRFDENTATKDIWKNITDDPQELSGILNWSIDGLNRLKNNNWIFTNIGSEDNIEFMMLSNPVKAFFSKCCEVVRGEWTSTEDLYDAYLDYCHNEGLGGDESIKGFGKKISTIPGLYQERRDVKNKGKRYGWRNVLLKVYNKTNNSDEQNNNDDEDIGNIGELDDFDIY